MLLPHEIKYLVFSGGGVRGYSYVGVLKQLEAQGVPLASLHGCGGTSIGALMAALVVAGWTPAELEVELLSVHAKEKVDLSLTCLLKRFGLDSGTTLCEYVDSLLFKKQAVPRMTFDQLTKLTGKRLVVVGTDLNNNTELVFDAEHTPHFPVAAACQMSMAVPGLFAPVEYGGTLVVDGGLKNNFPLKYFPPTSTLGVRVTWPRARSLTSVDQVLARAIYCILTDAEAAQWEGLQPVQRRNTLTVCVGDLSTIELHLTTEQKRAIMQHGELAVKRQLPSVYNQVVAEVLSASVCTLARQGEGV